MKCSPLTVQHFDHITFNSQWICISQLLRLDFPMWWHSHTCIPHTNSLCLQPFSPALSLSALQSVMDQRTCPKVLYRQHTCSMSLHADATLQLQPCTVDVCVCVDIQRWLHRLCEGPPVLCVCVCARVRVPALTLLKWSNLSCYLEHWWEWDVWPDAFRFRRWLVGWESEMIHKSFYITWSKPSAVWMTVKNVLASRSLKLILLCGLLQPVSYFFSIGFYFYQPW